MKFTPTKRFKASFKKLPPALQDRALKQLDLLLTNPFHPSLHTKKIKGLRDKIFEARITKSYRLIFKIQEEQYILLDIGKHEILDKI